MPFFDYFAAGPLANWAQLFSGPGAAPLVSTSLAYKGVQGALNSAAAGSDGIVSQMAEAWGGMSSQRAQSAFRKHNEWVRTQATAAQVLSTVADASVELHGMAVALMPSLPEIVAAIVARATAAGALAASAGSPMALVTGPAMATAELEYQLVRLRAAASMQTYEAGAFQVVGALLNVPIIPPPPIVIPGGGMVPTEPPDLSTPLQDLLTNGPDSQYLTDGGNGNGPNSPGEGPQSPGDTGPNGGDGGGGPDGGDPGPDLGQPTPDQQALSEIDQALANEPGFDPGSGGFESDLAAQDALFGTSTGSSTLAALSGGAAGLAALSMARGGISTMPGAATGFRLPGGWSPGAGTPFGASTGSPAGAPVRNAPKRVSAPTARMRRRRKEEEERTGKVFTPGEQFEVPVLERPPAIGVIEYQDDEPEEHLVLDSSLVGVLDRLDDEVRPDNEETSR
ncbi:PPE domain-containing protein [Nocardia sp. NPDC003345]